MDNNDELALWADVNERDRAVGITDDVFNEIVHELEASAEISPANSGRNQNVSDSSTMMDTREQPVETNPLNYVNHGQLTIKIDENTLIKDLNDVKSDLSTFIEGAQRTYLIVQNAVYDHLNTVSQITDEKMRIDIFNSFQASDIIKTHYSQLGNNFEVAARYLEQLSNQLDKAQIVPRNGSHTQPLAPQPSNRNQRQPMAANSAKTSDGKFILHMKMKTKDPVNPINVLNEAVKHTDVHVDDAKPVATGAKAFFITEMELNMAVEAVKGFKVGDKLGSDLFELKIETKSNFLFRSQTFSRNVYHEFRFQENGQIKLDAATKILAKKNRHWFDNESDIINVEVHTIPNKPFDLYLMDIHVSKKAYQTIVDGIKAGQRLDTETTRLVIHIPTKLEFCFKCHLPDHHANTCKKQIRCRFCIGSHNSGTCDVPKDPNAKYICYRCREHNAALPPNGTKRDEYHSATSGKCPDIKAARRKASKQINRGKPKHGAGRNHK